MNVFRTKLLDGIEMCLAFQLGEVTAPNIKSDEDKITYEELEGLAKKLRDWDWVHAPEEIPKFCRMIEARLNGKTKRLDFDSFQYNERDRNQDEAKTAESFHLSEPATLVAAKTLFAQLQTIVTDKNTCSMARIRHNAQRRREAFIDSFGPHDLEPRLAKLAENTDWTNKDSLRKLGEAYLKHYFPNGLKEETLQGVGMMDHS